MKKWLERYGPEDFIQPSDWKGGLLSCPLPDGRTLGDLTGTEVAELAACQKTWAEAATKRAADLERRAAGRKA